MLHPPGRASARSQNGVTPSKTATSGYGVCSSNMVNHVGCQTIQAAQIRAGPTFRYRPNAVLVNTPTAYRTIFGPKGSVKKSDYYRAWPHAAGVTITWNVTDIPWHTRKRHALNQPTSEKALRSIKPLMHPDTDPWLDLIKQNAVDQKHFLNMVSKINHLMFDVLGDLCFGKSFDIKESNRHRSTFQKCLRLALFRPICFTSLAYWWVWAKPRGLDRLLNIASPPAVTNLKKLVASCVEERTETEQTLQNHPEHETRKDFLHYLSMPSILRPVLDTA